MDAAMTAVEREALRNFVRLVYRMDKSRFIKSVRTQSQTISWQQGDADVTGPNYDWEDFRSFMTDFRQVAINKRDSAYFTKILGIAGRYGNDEFGRMLKDNKKKTMAILEGYYSGFQVEGEVDGKQVSYNTAELLDAITNGEIFHSEIEHQDAIKLVESNRLFTLWPVINFKIVPILQMMIGFFHELLRQNILTKVDYPAAWREEMEKKSK
jgi:hypothetical protein